LNRGSFDLTGKCAVVLGGTSGLGKAIALGLAEAILANHYLRKGKQNV